MNIQVTSKETEGAGQAAMDFLRRLFRQGATVRKLDAGSKSASRRDWQRLNRLLQACASNEDGEAAARARIAEVLAFYRGASDADKLHLFALLCQDFGPDETVLRQAIDRYLSASDATLRTRAEGELLRSLESPRRRILLQFNLLPHGVHALVNMRADMLRLGKNDAFLALEQDFMQLFSAWFDVGFLELKRIGWESPASLLEKLIRYEAVHEIKSWNDLRNRLDSDRRCYAFFHNRMPDEPLIFVEVALVQEIADNVQALLDESQPTLDPNAATTAIFYSISNTQNGLKGVSMGEFLIKRVVQQLLSEYPRLRTFATLSPIPGFGRWLERQLDDPVCQAQLPGEVSLLLSGEPGSRSERLRHAVAAAAPANSSAQRAIRSWLQAECARYLLNAKQGALPLDPVARFHFANGASLAQINWQADTSAHGLRQSLGLMVNYLYKIDDIEANHDAYARDGRLATSASVRRFLERSSKPRSTA